MSRENTSKKKKKKTSVRPKQWLALSCMLVLCVVVACLELQQGQAQGKEHDYLITTQCNLLVTCHWIYAALLFKYVAYFLA